MISSSDIAQLVKPYLEKEHVHLCDLKVSGRAGRPQIQLFLDWEVGNITVDACAAISRQIQYLIDMQEWAPGDYQLIVSSPGIDYPLRELWQFCKNVGQLIRTTGTDNTIEGRIVEVQDEEHIKLELGNGIAEFSIAELSGAKVVLEKPAKKKLKRKRNEA